MPFYNDNSLEKSVHTRLDKIGRTLSQPCAALDKEDMEFLRREGLLVTAGPNNAMDRGLTLNAVRQRKAKLLVTMTSPVPNVRQGAQKGQKVFATT